MRNKSRKESNTAHLRKALKFEEDDRSQFTVNDIVEAIRAAGVIWARGSALEGSRVWSASSRR